MGERLPKGVRKHIRIELSEARKSGDSRVIKNAEAEAAHLRGGVKPSSRNPDEARLQEVSVALTDENITNEQSAELALEGIWLQFKLHQIDSPTRRRQHHDLLKKLETENPVGLDWLDQTVGYDSSSGNPVSRSSMIRDRVLRSSTRREK